MGHGYLVRIESVCTHSVIHLCVCTVASYIHKINKSGVRAAARHSTALGLETAAEASAVSMPRQEIGTALILHLPSLSPAQLARGPQSNQCDSCKS